MLVHLARPWLSLSVSKEPLWRLLNLTRGSYVTRLDNTPGYVQDGTKSAFLSFGPYLV